MKNLKTNPYRLAFQFTILGILIYMGFRLFLNNNYYPDFEAYCPFGGVQALSSYFVNNSLACTMTSAQIVMGLALLVIIVFASKLFCSYICPIGTVSEWIGRLGERFKLRYTLDSKLDKPFRILKYVLLFVTVYFTVTSSELFCKKFDPYYAIASGFDLDVSIIMGIASIVLVIAGSFFVNLFWCKYVCPLGALSNIFRYFLVFIAILAVYIFILLIGIKLSFVWVLAVLCIVSYILELLSIENKAFPIFRITRNVETCTNCFKCSSTCPQAIDVASLEKVNHTDCNLCCDCIQACPEKGALTINKKGGKWIPFVILIVLISVGVIIGKSFEVPTISEYWGDSRAKAQMSIYEQSDLKNIKCFGSSTSFAKKMKRVKGIAGVETYVGSHTVKIWYDPSIVDTTGIKKSIFVPVKVPLVKLDAVVDSAAVFSLKVDNFFDPYDTFYLTTLLKQNPSILGFTTEYSCPINITIYSMANVDESTIRNLVQQNHLNITYSDNSTQDIKLNYRVVKMEGLHKKISPEELIRCLK